MVTRLIEHFRNRTAHILNQDGAAAMIMVMVILIMISIFFFQLTEVARIKKLNVTSSWKTFQARQAAINGIVAMEAALQARLWEAPAETRNGESLVASDRGLFTENRSVPLCFKRERFALEALMPSKVKVNVDVKYDVRAKMINMTSSILEIDEETENLPPFKFQKAIVVSDVSDYLVASMSEKDTVLDRETALIAEDRKLYFNGLVTLKTGRERPDPLPGFWNPSQFIPQRDVSIIIQASKMYFLGGLTYGVMPKGVKPPKGLLMPNGIYSLPDRTNLSTSANSLVSSGFFSRPSPLEQFYFQHPVGAYFTDSTTLADNMLQAIETNDGSLVPTDWSTNLYPIALMGGSDTNWPIISDRTDTPYSDNGNFYSDHGNTFPMMFHTISNVQLARDFTCGMFDIRGDKRCSNSNDWPRGFAAWKEAARSGAVPGEGLESVIITQDPEEVIIPTFTWDHYTSLETDAKVCGLYVEGTSTPGISPTPIQDCDLTDRGFIESYINDQNTQCRTIEQLELDNLVSAISSSSAMGLLTTSDYEDADLEPYSLRRVVYTDGSLLVEQKYNTGFWPGVSGAIRERLPIWVVTERDLILQPQRPTTGPDANPVYDGSMPLNDFSDTNLNYRRLLFNEDLATINGGTGVTPLSLVFVSPEQMQIVPPFEEQRWLRKGDAGGDKDDLLSMYPVDGDVIRPKNHIFTDHFHLEDGAYAYGLRDIHISNLATITSTRFPSDRTFFLKGLWGINGPNNSSPIINQCMLAYPASTGFSNARMTWDLSAVLFSSDYTNHEGNSDVFIPPFDANPANAGSATSSKFYKRYDVNPGQWDPDTDDQYTFPIPAGGPWLGEPAVFVEQARLAKKADLDRHSSKIVFKGIQYNIEFENKLKTPTSPPSENLGTAKITRTHILRPGQFDISDRFWGLGTCEYRR